jgi:hypothetical protein
MMEAKRALRLIVDPSFGAKKNVFMKKAQEGDATS